MKGLLLTGLLMMGTCVLLSAAAADARGWQSDMILAQAQGHPKRGGPPPGQGQFQRGNPGRQQQGQQGGQNQREQGRLTQEERQGLHRDLDRANREIYRR
ncbi:MAG TPA: hypothetical protein VJQ51_01910 [Burkholderiales bacterium]|nr:hypothetical protein [Burkholderiales bacterium]